MPRAGLAHVLSFASVSGPLRVGGCAPRWSRRRHARDSSQRVWDLRSCLTVSARWSRRIGEKPFDGSHGDEYDADILFDVLEVLYDPSCLRAIDITGSTLGTVFAPPPIMAKVSTLSIPGLGVLAHRCAVAP